MSWVQLPEESDVHVFIQLVSDDDFLCRRRGVDVILEANLIEKLSVRRNELCSAKPFWTNHVVLQVEVTKAHNHEKTKNFCVININDKRLFLLELTGSID